MASWHYAFLFPGTGRLLLPANLIEVFIKYGMSFDGIIRPAVVIDEVGHLEYGDEVELSGNTNVALARRLGDNEQFQVECRNDELFLSISFATQYFNPYVMIGWSRKLFAQLPESTQYDYWRVFRKAAQECNASYVVLVDDPPDYFEDRFLEIDGQRYLEEHMPSGRRYDIRGVWRNVRLSGRPPDGVGNWPGFDIGDGFVEYRCPVS